VKTLLATSSDDLNDVAYYDIIELLFYLSLIIGKDQDARNCLALLTDKFGEDLSPRIAVLKAMLLQATKGTEQAIEHLGSRPSDELLSLKKRVALSKYTSNSDKYVDSLLGYLDIAPLDVETWSELGEVYYSQGHLDKAIWALQEILLIQPFNYYIFARIGELEHALFKRDSKRENLKASIKHFSRSVELCSNFVRGWAGLFITTKVSKDEKLHALAKRQLEVIVENKRATYQDLEHASKILQLE
jgi:tetratricopeptide (TPR) repeat protein